MSRPVFKRSGLEKHYDFDSEELAIIRPLLPIAPDEYQVKASIAKVITLLAHRNDIITVADKDPTVWDFVEQHSNDCISPRTRFLKVSERLETALSLTHFLLWEARSGD